MTLQRHQLHHVPVFTPHVLSHHQPKHPFKQKHNLSFSFPFSSPNFQRPKDYVALKLPKFETPRSRNFEGSMEIIKKEEEKEEEEEEDLSVESPVYKKTLRLVECSMFAALSGLVYFLSNSLNIENYFGCFFALPIVLSSMRWGIPAGRKTMVATSILLFVISGPLKALTYLLMHGFLGFTLGSLWRPGPGLFSRIAVPAYTVSPVHMGLLTFLSPNLWNNFWLPVTLGRILRSWFGD